MSTVYVLNKDGKPLMPTTRCGHVRRLLKEQKAQVVTSKPFTIQLLYETDDVVQPLYLGIDPGRTNIGVAVVKIDGTAVFTAHLEGQETEQEAAIEKLLADAAITDTAPATTVFGETVKDDVVIEADDGYLQLQLNDNTVLVSTFSFNYDKNVFSKTLNLPGGLTVRYGNVQDKETGYIPFVSSVSNRNIKILATSVNTF